MARRANNPHTTDELPEEHAPPIVGGSEGIPEEMATNIPEPGKATSVAYKAPDPSIPTKKITQYRVLRDSRFVSQGSIGVMRTGKVIDDNQYDIDQVRAQGVPLEEIKG